MSRLLNTWCWVVPPSETAVLNRGWFGLPPWGGGRLAMPGDIFGCPNLGGGCFWGSSGQRLRVLRNILQCTEQLPQQRLTWHECQECRGRGPLLWGSQKKLILDGVKEPPPPPQMCLQMELSVPHPTPQAGNWILPPLPSQNREPQTPRAGPAKWRLGGEGTGTAGMRLARRELYGLFRS